MNEIQTIRHEALELAGHLYDGEGIPHLWELASFFEAFILHGAEGTQEYAPVEPAEATVLRVIPR